MKQRRRRGFTTAEKAELWDRYQRGESLNAIGRVKGGRSNAGILTAIDEGVTTMFAGYPVHAGQ